MSTTIDLPKSYSALPWEHIRVSHVPASSPTPTKVIIVTLYRPEKYNAFTEKMSQEMQKVYQMLDVDDRVKAIVLTGQGKMYCAGADLDIGFPKGTEETPQEHRDGGGRMSLGIHQCRKPTIVALNGSAVGIGMTMILPAAIRIAYEKAKVGFVFTRRGLVMEAASHYFLPRLIGHSKAMHLITTGSTYPATHPLVSSLFTEIVPTPEATVERAIELATDIAENTSNVAWALNRDLMWRGGASAEEAHLLDSKVIFGLFGKRDNREGVQSFLEKRKPDFKASFANPEDLPPAYPWWTPVDTKLRPKASKL